MLMVWGWLIRRLTGGSQDPGFFGYLTSRDQNKTRIERDKVRMEETKEIISRLPYSAVYREGTADGWREIQMPPPPPVFVFPEEYRPPREPMDLPDPPKALDQEIPALDQDPPGAR